MKTTKSAVQTIFAKIAGTAFMLLLAVLFWLTPVYGDIVIFNQTDDKGAAFYIQNETRVFIDTAFIFNKALSDGGALYVDNGLLQLGVSTGQSAFFSGNMANDMPNAIYLMAGPGSGQASLTVDTAGGAVLDMRDPLTGMARGDGNTINISKSGTGIWKLGGVNEFKAEDGGKTTFIVAEGTLHLYRADAVVNPNPADTSIGVAAGSLLMTDGESSFTLASGATLIVGGGNVISAYTTTFESGAILSFDYGYYDFAPMLDLSGSANVSLSSGVTIDLLSISGQASGNVTLLKSIGFAFTNYTVTIRGETLNGTRAASVINGVSQIGSNVNLNHNAMLQSEVLTWNTADGIWNITEDVWRNGAAPSQFLHGDIVNFQRAATGANQISLNPGGVQAAAMGVSGAADYIFSGGNITIDGVGGTSFYGQSSLGKLVLGGYYDDLAQFTAADYTGVVDLTQTGRNEFMQGIEIYGGTLRIAAKSQIGLVYGRLAFKSAFSASLDVGAQTYDGTAASWGALAADWEVLRISGKLGTLTLAQNREITLLGVTDLPTALAVVTGDAGWLVLESGAKLNITAAVGTVFHVTGFLALTNSSPAAVNGFTFANNNLSAPLINNGGSFSLNSALFDKNTGQTTLLHNTGLLNLHDVTFSGNTASSGGIILNQSGIATIGNATFSANKAVTGVISSQNAIFTITASSFADNIVTAASGSVLQLSSGGSLTLISTQFSGNTAVQGGAVGVSAAGLTITSGTFTGNAAITGGALYAASGSEVTLNNTNFTANSATIGGAVYLDDATVHLNVTGGKTMSFSDNTANSAPEAFYLHANNAATKLDITTADGGVLDLRNPINGLAVGGSQLQITKNGAGVWKLGGDSILSMQSVADSAVLNVNAGELYLYRTNEVADNAYATGLIGAGTISFAGTNGVFTVKSGARLTAMGGNSIKAGFVVISGGATLGFGISSADNGSNNAILSLTAQSFDITNGLTGALNFSINLKNWLAGTYTLLTVSGGGAATAFAGLTDELLAGVTITLNDTILDESYRTVLKLSNDRTSLILTTAIADENAVLTWNAADGVWDASIANWTGKNSGKFVAGDAVNFTSVGTGTNYISIVATGVETTGFYFSGEQTYLFSGGAVTKAPDTELSGPAVTYKLVLGAKATGVGLDLNTGFSGRVDFTGLSNANAFDTVDLYGGTLVISRPNQLGVTLAKLHFLSAGMEVANVATLEIAAGSMLTFDGVAATAQRLSLAADCSGAIVLTADNLGVNGAQITWRNSAADDGNGGAIYLNAGSVLSLKAQGDAAYLLSANSAAFGGALYNDGGSLSLANTSFSRNTATNAGGALFVRNGMVTLTLTDNHTTQWSGNLVNGLANALYLEAVGADTVLNVNTASGSLLDMRDPMGGAALTNNLSISKTGAGQWKLGGTNIFTSQSGRTVFTVSAGELYLYHDGAVANANSSNAAAQVTAGCLVLEGGASVFTLANGAKLTSMGGNRICASSVTISGGAQLHFAVDATNHTAASLTLAAGELNIGAGLVISVDFSVWSAGLYTLVDGGVENVFNAAHIGDASLATLNGMSLHPDFMAVIMSDNTGRYLQIKISTKNYAMTWTPGLGGALWDYATDNWLGGRDWDTFAAGDAVNFTAGGSQQIDITGGGVKVSGLYFSGAGTYVFSGGRLTAADETSLTGEVAGGKLILGAVATGTLLNTAAGFSGQVDFSGLNSANSFHGVDLYGGTLIISSTAQLGVTLDKLQFLASAAEVLHSSVLKVAQNANLVFDGAGAARQRLAVQSGKSGVISLLANGLDANGAVLTWQNSGDGSQNGGALSLAAHSKLELTALGNARYQFTENTALRGGAIYNDGGALRIVNGSFSDNIAMVEGGAVLVRNGNLDVTVLTGQTALWSGNLAAGAANVLRLAAEGQTVSLTVNLAANAELDMRDPMSGHTMAGDIDISKTGTGLWRLGGANVFTSTSGKTALAVDAGELYLYRTGEVANANQNNAAARVGAGTLTLSGAGSSFTLAGGERLTAGGGNRITTDDAIVIEDNARLNFGLDTAAYGGALLTLSAALLSIGSDLLITVNIEQWGLGTFSLVDAGTTGIFDDADIAAGSYITLNGNALTGEYRAVLFSDDSGRYLQIKTSVKNHIMTWSHNGSVWDGAAANWAGNRATGVFWDGDVVNFRGVDTQVDVAVQTTGVKVGGLYFSGNNYFAFSGGDITYGETTELAEDVTGGRLILGAWAYSNSILLTASGMAAFNGTVDFNGLVGRNSFTGVEIYGGTLVIGHADHLGVTPAKLQFLAAANTLNPATLEIAPVYSVIFDGIAEPLAYRLTLADTKSGVISLRSDHDGTELIWRNSGSVTDGGALCIGDNALLTLAAETDAAYLFEGNTARNGGAVFVNGGALKLVNASFIKNNAVAQGGALLNRNGNVQFAVLANQTSLWQGNLANNRANSIHLTAMDSHTANLTFDIAAGALLDMRDPMSGSAGTGTVGDIVISKSGAGQWKLGGNNVFTAAAGGKTVFTVRSGELYLYRADESANANAGNASAKVAAGNIVLTGSDSAFMLESHTVLTVRGGNYINSGGILSIASGVMLNFALDGAQNGAAHDDNALLKLAAGTYDIATGGALNFDINLSEWRTGAFTLISGEEAFAGVDAAQLATLTVAGQALALGARMQAALKTDGRNLLWLETAMNNNLVLDWRFDGNHWNISAANWSQNGVIEALSFVYGDVVNFNGTDDSVVTVQSAGVESAGIYFGGTGHYTFSGGAIKTSQTSTLTNAIVSGKLILGRTATATSLIDDIFSGVVDFTTLTGDNNFDDGVDLHGGKLLIANVGQLGTVAAKLNFLGDAQATDNEAVLEVAANGRVVFDGSVGGLASGDQRLTLVQGKAGVISLKVGAYDSRGAQLVWRTSAAGMANGGAIFVDTGALLVLAAAGNAFYEFNANSAARGGAVNINGGEFTVTNGVFTGNMAMIQGGAVYNVNGRLELAVTADQTALFSGNLAAGSASSIYLQASQGLAATLDIDVAANATLVMLDSMGGAAQDGVISITKSGLGRWRLGGENVFTASGNGRTTLTVSAGDLYLYAANEVLAPVHGVGSRSSATGVLTLNGANDVFVLARGGSLTVNGANRVTAGSITIADGATLNFNLDFSQASMLKFTAASGLAGFSIGSNLAVNVNMSHWKTGTFTLVDAGLAGVFNDGNIGLIDVAVGGGPVGDRRVEIVVGDNGRTLQLVTNHLLNVVMYWTAAENNQWNISAANWHDGGIPARQMFSMYDAVNFDGVAAEHVSIQIAQDVAVAGMYLSGNRNYSFSGAAISADGDNSDLKVGSEGKLVLGAYSNKNGVHLSAFSGILDFTGITGFNDFTGGVELYSGILRIAKSGQLGTDLSRLNFLSATDASHNGILRVAAGSTLVFDSAGDADQRLRIRDEKSGAIVLEDNASFVWQNGGNGLFGGALYVGENAVFTLQAVDTARFSFKNNQAMWGGALHNLGRLALNAAAFANNSSLDSGGAVFNGPAAKLVLSAATFTDNTADQAGGAFNNSGKAELDATVFQRNLAGGAGGAINNNAHAELILTDTVFTGNQAKTSGGAIYNHGGTLTLMDTSFIGNSASGLGGALYLYNGRTEIKVTDTDKASVFSGNTAHGASSSLYLAAGDNGAAQLVLHTTAGTTLDIQDALAGMAGNASASGNINISKQGAGLWKLSGKNVFEVDAWNAGKTDFVLQAGTLYLYAQSELVEEQAAASLKIAGNGQVASVDNSVFSMASGSKLVLGGSGHIIEISDGGAVNLADAVTLGFNLANFVDHQQPALNVIADKVNFGADANDLFNLTVDVSGWRAGEWVLADFNVALAGIKSVITITSNGQKYDNERMEAEVVMRGTQLVFAAVSDFNLALNWSGAQSNLWDYSAYNWLNAGAAASQFINGDFVSFTGTAGGEVKVADSGMIVSGMLVERDDYIFSGGSISSALATNVKFASQELFDALFTEKLVINGGSVVINNQLMMAKGVEVNAGVLGGSGVITGDVTFKSGAALSPGNSIGTLTINGALSMEAGSVYHVNLLLGSTLSDEVVVHGLVTVEDAVVNYVKLAGAGDYSQVGSWVILRSDSEIQGVGFAKDIATQYAFINFKIRNSDDNKAVIMDMSLKNNSFADFAYTRNQRAVAFGLGSLGRGGLYNVILGLPLAYNFAGLYDQLSGEAHASLAGMLLNYDRAFGMDLRNRVTARDFKADGSPLWVSLDGFAMTADGSANTAETKFNGGGLTLGAEVQFGESFMLGAAFRYGDSQLKADESHSKIEVESFSFALYSGLELGRVSRGDWRVTAGVSYGLHNADSSRKIKDPDLTQQLKADYASHNFQVFGEVGWRFNITKGLTFEPYAGVAWNMVHTGDFHETGGNAALYSADRTNENFATTLGVRGELRLFTNLGLKGDIYWQRLYGDVNPVSRFNFNGGEAFTIWGASMNHDAMGVNFMVKWRLWSFLDVQGGYDGLFGDGFQSHRGNLKLIINF